MARLLLVVAVGQRYLVDLPGPNSSVESLLAHQANAAVFVAPIVFAAFAINWSTALSAAAWVALLWIPAAFLVPGDGTLQEGVSLAAMAGLTAVTVWLARREQAAHERFTRSERGMQILARNGYEMLYASSLETPLPAVISRIATASEAEECWLWVTGRGHEGDSFIGGPATAASVERARQLHTVAIGQLRGSPVGVGMAIDGGWICPLAPDDPEGALAGAIFVRKQGSGRITRMDKTLVANSAGQIRYMLTREAATARREADLALFGRKTLQAQEEERLRLSRELHDETIQELTALVRYLEGSVCQPAGEPAAAQAATDLARESLKGVRRIAQSLRPSILDDFGLCAAIEQLANEAGLSVDGCLDTPGAALRLDPNKQLAMFRIAQEAITNARKHAPGRPVHVRLGCDGSKVVVEVVDEGPGFDLPGTHKGALSAGHLGLAGMFERAELAGIALIVDSSPGAGTTIRATVAADAEYEIESAPA